MSENKEQLSPEELAKRKDEITAFYKDAIEHLKIQKEYEELLRDIEVARTERIQAQLNLAQFYANQAPPKDESQETEEKEGLEPDLPRRPLRTS